MLSATTESTTGERVTSLAHDPRRPGCLRVGVQGGALFAVPAEVVRRLGLEKGSRLGPGAGRELEAAADAEAALRTALRCLARRPFARRDLAGRLRMKGHPPAAAEAAVGRAAELGLIDDEAFARQYVESRFARGRGPARLRRELIQLGVEPALVEGLLADAIPQHRAGERMLALARKRASQLQGLQREERLRRVVAYLARRGFTGPQVRRTVRELV